MAGALQQIFLATSGGIPGQGSFTGIDGADAGAFTGDIYVMGSLSATDGADSGSFTGPAWATTFSQTLNADSTGWNGFNIRQHIAATLMSNSGAKFRVTIEAAVAAGCTISGMHGGHAATSGDAFDWDGTQVPITFNGGSTTVTLSAAEVKLSDEITYAVDETKAFMVAAHFNAVSSVRGRTTVTGATAYFKSAANETGTTDVSTYSSTASAVRLIQKIEVSP